MGKTGDLTPCLELSINGLGTQVVMHPWDLTASASLGSLALKEMTHGHGGGPLYLVQTPVGAELLSVKFTKVIFLINPEVQIYEFEFKALQTFTFFLTEIKVESEHPEYNTRFKSTQQSVDVEFSSLQVILHQEALLNIIDLSTKILPPRYCLSLKNLIPCSQLTQSVADVKPPSYLYRRIKKNFFRLV